MGTGSLASLKINSKLAFSLVIVLGAPKIQVKDKPESNVIETMRVCFNESIANNLFK
jgi:hypothetical protein